MTAAEGSDGHTGSQRARMLVLWVPEPPPDLNPDPGAMLLSDSHSHSPNSGFLKDDPGEVTF